MVWQVVTVLNMSVKVLLSQAELVSVETICAYAICVSTQPGHPYVDCHNKFSLPTAS